MNTMAEEQSMWDAFSQRPDEELQLFVLDKVHLTYYDLFTGKGYVYILNLDGTVKRESVGEPNTTVLERADAYMRGVHTQFTYERVSAEDFVRELYNLAVDMHKQRLQLEAWHTVIQFLRYWHNVSLGEKL